MDRYIYRFQMCESRIYVKNRQFEIAMLHLMIVNSAKKVVVLFHNTDYYIILVYLFIPRKRKSKNRIYHHGLRYTENL